eukprot:TRINITY_DN6536_c0_g1_i1.p1 TRINITY_DN6536_c0_g1~~TRINITY_DN6536_c0_g1_i1.p1  ORF type:complete len:375 (+),score=90.93 TRINITY_DN6536_c0_g1_i1:64-1125(+)
MERGPALVVDVGADSCRIGFAGSEAPRVFSSSRSRTAEGDSSWLDYDASGAPCWDTEVLRTLLELSCSSCVGAKDLTGVSVLLSEPNVHCRRSREAIAELLFESLQASAVSFEKTAALSAFAFGRTNAVVVDCGAALSSAAAVVQGAVDASRLRTAPHAGRMLDAALLEALGAQGVSQLGGASGSDATGSRKRLRSSGRLAQDLKESVCYCSHSPLPATFDADAPPHMHTLPDGQRINVAPFARAVPEKLLVGARGLPALLAEARGGGGAEDVVFVGGSSLFVNLGPRLKAAMSSGTGRAPSAFIEASHAGRHAAWLGGSVRATCCPLLRTGCSREEYAEHGAAILFPTTPVA